MLTVKTPEEVLEVIFERFKTLGHPAENVLTADLLGRVLSGDIVADEFVPGFDRSTVDGYAVLASDTFGCSDSIPAVLELSGEILMGKAANCAIKPGVCFAVSTGGDLPEGTDAVVMLEHTEDYGDGLIGIMTPAASGNNIIYKGSDISPGDRILAEGAVIGSHDIGLLSALGVGSVGVRPKPLVGIISTGDELVKPSETPRPGQVRDVNAPMLKALMEQSGAEAVSYGIVRDDERALRNAVATAAAQCDVVLISGGSSAGMRDLTARVIGNLGEMLLHGVAMKPGKPTILGDIGGKAVFGLPGHPAAAWFVAELFVRPLTARLAGVVSTRRTVTACLSEAISSNHGREEYVAVQFTIHNVRNNAECGMQNAELSGWLVRPVRSKSGLISGLTRADGYICIPRDSEGLHKDTLVSVVLF